MPTATPDPTATIPIDEGGQKPAPESLVLAPLSTTDLQAFMSEVSDSEWACLSANIAPERLALLVGAPDLSMEEEGAAFIGCLEHETLLRWLLTPVLGQTGALSTESSMCICDSFGGADLSSMMIASVSGEDPEAAMGNMMAGFFATLACPNDEEFRAASPALGMGPEDRQGLQCLLDELGGPEGVAALLSPDSGPPNALFSAALECNLQLSGESSSTPVPANTPTSAPIDTPTDALVPTATPAPIATSPAPTLQPATQLRVAVAAVPHGLPSYDRGDWRHWTDEDGDCRTHATRS